MANMGVFQLVIEHNLSSHYLFSIRMRAAANANDGGGEQHLSGCERLVPGNQVASVVQNLLRRISAHTRGKADMINIRIDKIKRAKIWQIPALKIESLEFATMEQSHGNAIISLMEFGVSEIAAHKGIELIKNLSASMRGGMVLNAVTGERIDNFGDRGVRLSHMDCKNEPAFLSFMAEYGVGGEKVREAVILASKAAFAKDYVAELCWSDDPHYVTGYVASKEIYRRLSPMKSKEDNIGGRVFFVKSSVNLNDLIDFFENQPVLVEVPRK
ncbi:MAG: 6-carboxyhexanoate--CoA ligase [Puniceicoccales bacterium]|jgi:6-carboxyhexanoate--CoA ligase|nr:6-carboxyhexanoate--CoA ligase [Puniceicoccales bacterium]